MDVDGKILIFDAPELGHYIPTLRVAKSLRLHGHEVIYVTVPVFSDFFSRLGFDHVTVLANLFPSRSPSDLFSSAGPSGELAARIDEVLSHSQMPLHELILPEICRFPADIVLCDSVFAKQPGIVENVRKPVVLIATSLPENSERAVPELVLCPEEFELPDSLRNSTQRHYCEPSIWRHPLSGTPLPTTFGSDETLVYCCFGTQAIKYLGVVEVVRGIVSAFRQLPNHRLILSAGPLLESITKLSLPHNVSVFASVRQLELLGQVRVAITHGGLGSIKETIMSRIPMIVIPFSHDQPANGRRVEFHGLGRVCAAPECSDVTLRELITSLSEDRQTKERVSAMSSVFWRRENRNESVKMLCEIAKSARLLS